MNATLKISKEDLPIGGMQQTIRTLADWEINGEIVPNLSAVNGKVERGLTVTLFDVTGPTIRSVFRWLRNQFGLTCAWLDTDSYSGCILKWPKWDEGGSCSTYDDQPTRSGTTPGAGTGTEVGVREGVERYAGQPSPGTVAWDAIDQRAGRVPRNRS
jgi:hypothetical protein